MYRPKHFIVEELVSKSFFEAHGEKKSWWMIDDRVLITLDQLRERFGQITINNWKWAGDRQYSGLRVSGDPYYSITSQHSYGRAVDCLFANVSAEEVRQYIKDNPDEFPYINFIEDDVSWLHFDVRNCDRIMTWSPNG